MPTVPQLKELAKAKGIYIPSKAKKADVEEALRKAGTKLPVKTKVVAR